MKLPVMQGVIDRRILANYRADPKILAKVLPAPFRPKLVAGKGIAGICLIRLKQIRPRFAPAFLGIASENAAHRIAVEWEQNGEHLDGVYIPRRDTSSRLNAIAGGRVFPGVHHHAKFDVDEHEGHYAVTVNSDDGAVHIAVEGLLAQELPAASVFRSVAAASEFFRCGSCGYSATPIPGEYDGLELRTFGWEVRPLAIERLESSYFDDRNLFPAGSIEFDSALLMEGLCHEWRERPLLRAMDAALAGSMQPA